MYVCFAESVLLDGKMLSSGNFACAAWRAVHSRQAAHAANAYSGFLGRNRLAVHTRPPGDTCWFH